MLVCLYFMRLPISVYVPVSVCVRVNPEWDIWIGHPNVRTQLTLDLASRSNFHNRFVKLYYFFSIIIITDSGR